MLLRSARDHPAQTPATSSATDATRHNHDFKVDGWLFMKAAS
jgi:hypothetical protein